MSEDEKLDLKPIAVARHGERDAEHYLKNIIKVSSYIENIASVLETAAAELKAGDEYKEAISREKGNFALNARQRSSVDLVNYSESAAHNLKTGLDNAEKLARNDGKLASGEVRSISSLAKNAEAAERNLTSIASLTPSTKNGLSEETAINAQAALDVIKNKLQRIANAPTAEQLVEYNDNFIKRMAAAQIDHRGGRKEGFKQRKSEEVESYKDTARKSEIRRTGTANFREALEGERNQQASESLGR